MPQLHQSLSLRGCLIPVLTSFERRESREFHFKDAHFHIRTNAWEAVTNRIMAERLNLEAFIKDHPEFQKTLKPIDLALADSLLPETVKRMQQASRLTGLGPMASVAGTMAQLAVEASREAGSPESLVENGGDIYLESVTPLVLGLYAGPLSPFQNLALKILPEQTPLAVCTSSGRMGHSLSFGDCDLVTVFAKEGALADAAATLGGNLVKEDGDIEPALNRLLSINGVLGAIIIRDKRFGTVGELPELIKSLDPDLQAKVSRDDESNFQNSY
ncbi:UPF0280 family protein [Oceanispirochaeta crateris]|uniref:UPF0280 family protein n=1 Tax=Oceanispirochaeta crateris TaxID=2518645 RepID=A0A5C1QHS3_9SPIO|nr:UPF0280 family protein [Oceanispirochaeta crateris]QEN06540.1 UPF0280 family protein [Oceanispirochaeta crateris]